MKAIVLGMGVSGKAAARYLINRGDQVLGVDRFPQCVEGIEVISETDTTPLEGVDLVVKSPGVAKTHVMLQEACERKIPVLSEIDLALAELSKQKKKLYAITGSNGKT